MPIPLAGFIISFGLMPSLSPLFFVILLKYSTTTLQLYLALGPSYLK